MRICFVAHEILGPFSGGGIATALAGQAEHHAAEHDVTVLYAHPGLDAADAPEWEEYFAKRNIAFVAAEFDTFFPLDTFQKRSFAVKQYLTSWDQQFDVIFFHDYLGLGYYTALTRKLGLGLEKTLIGTVIHGPSEWARTLNMVNEDAADITLYEIERKQAEYSDFVVGPSRHILDWCVEHGWNLPDKSHVISNILPNRLDIHSGLKQGQVFEHVTELAYFGRLEVRKGFFVFLDAINYLRKHDRRMPQKITFLGSFCTNSERNSASTVLEYAQNWDIDIQFLNNHDHEAAIRYLVNNRPLAVVPSLDESFGLTAYECLAFGVPALISNRGPLATMPAEPEREAILFEPQANVLGERIAQALDEGVTIGAVDPAHLAAAGRWDALLAELEADPATAPDAWDWVVSIDDMTAHAGAEAAVPERIRPEDRPADPLVSVILVHHNRPETLRPALESLLAQTYPNIEIVLVDDGSRPGELHQVERLLTEVGDCRVRLVRQANRYLGAARNFGVKNAKGEFLLFMDDDNIAMPEEVAVLVDIAVRSGAQVLNPLSCMFRMVGGERHHFDIYLPVGPSLPLALFGNTFGDANALVCRKLFENLGGFTEDYGVGAEDYEFFNKAFIAGARMQLVPEILFEYRSERESMMKELNSGKYIINQERGVRPLFNAHRTVDLGQLRGVMRVAYFDAIGKEYSYWVARSIEERAHPELENRLADLRYRPNSPAACQLIAQLLAAYGRIREAVAFMERNEITPDDNLLRQMQNMLARYERRNNVTGEQQNALVNGAFDFWIWGKRHEGIDPYQYFANEWFIASSKRRGALVASQEQDNALYSLTRSRTGKFLRLQTAEPDPGGYCFLVQRIVDFGSILENQVDLSLLARSTQPGPLNAFMRVTEEHGTEAFADVWPETQTWVSEDWKLLDLRFDLTGYNLDDFKDASFVSLLISIPMAAAMKLDLTDMVLVPHGKGVTIGSYMRENERIRAHERVFISGQGARFQPLGNRNLRVDLGREHAGRLNRFSKISILSGVVLSLADGNFMEIEVEEARWQSDPDARDGDGYIHVKVDREIGQVGVAMENFMVISNYVMD